MRAELGESWEHLVQAATHAANGVGKSVGPRAHMMGGMASRGWDSTSAALAPLMAAYREGAADAATAALKLKSKAKSRKKGKDVAKKRKGMLVGLLAAGAAVGAASALVMRRRRRQQWSEYDPTEALDSVSSDARSMREMGMSGGTMEKMTSRASKAMDKTADKLHSAASSMRKTDTKSKADEAAEASNDLTDDLTSKYSTSTSISMDNRL